MELVNGKDDIPYVKWKMKFMFETTNQPWFSHVRCIRMGWTPSCRMGSNRFVFIQHDFIRKIRNYITISNYRNVVLTRVIDIQTTTNHQIMEKNMNTNTIDRISSDNLPLWIMVPPSNGCIVNPLTSWAPKKPDRYRSSQDTKPLYHMDGPAKSCTTNLRDGWNMLKPYIYIYNK